MPTRVLVFLILSAVASLCRAQIDDSFKTRAMEHVRYLAGLENRLAGSSGEAKAIEYIRNQFDKLGMPTAVEPFEFDSYDLEKAVLAVGEERADVTPIIFDPLRATDKLTGDATFLPPAVARDRAALAAADLNDKLVITTVVSVAFSLPDDKHPVAIAIVAPADFERLSASGGKTAAIEIKGRKLRVKSANVMGSIAAGDENARYVMVSAHLDSADCPGAHDNASGVAVMIELARHFRNAANKPSFGLKFVAFGAEEAGLVGARAYLAAHRKDLENCAMLFNVDSVGGKDDPFVEMRGGVRGIEDKNQIPSEFMDRAFSDPRGRWLHVPRGIVDFSASNVPAWLAQAITETSKELGYQFRPAQGMGSDHRVFAQAGIVSTNIAVSGGPKSHTREDVVEQIDPAGLEKAGRIVAGVVRKVKPAF